MGSSQTVTVKYVVRAKFEIDGVVEKPDVIGAVFGQTEGLFGPELDLRELQKSGRIGRIEINLQSKQDKTAGTITIPTSLDRVSTAILAASLESINRVGPCES
jgi:DNA primase